MWVTQLQVESLEKDIAAQEARVAQATTDLEDIRTRRDREVRAAEMHLGEAGIVLEEMRAELERRKEWRRRHGY